MFNFIKKLFSKKPDFTEEECNAHYEKKSSALSELLGDMHDLVGHAIIPFAIGGAVDMYYFPRSEHGLAFATMELIEPDGSGPKPNKSGKTYELVAFTEEKYTEKEDSAFSKIERRMCGIFTAIGNYSYQAVLNPLETCEIPDEDGDNNCIIFDEYTRKGQGFTIGGKEHTLLLVMEVFRSEMEYAMENGSWSLIAKLKEAGYYPRSDLAREPVV